MREKSRNIPQIRLVIGTQREAKLVALNGQHKPLNRQLIIATKSTNAKWQTHSHDLAMTFFIANVIKRRAAHGFPYLAVKYHGDALPLSPAMLGPAGPIIGEIAHCRFECGAVGE